jgi:hypothetical protein
MHTKNMTKRIAHTSSLSDRQRRIYNFLKEQRIGVLSTVTPDNNPHGVVVYYTVEQDFTIGIVTKRGTRKYENLLHNNHAMLTVFDAYSQATLQITGIAVERGSQDDIIRISGAALGGVMRTSRASLPPIIKLQAGQFTTIQIEPVSIRMATYANPQSGDYDALFESIESFDFKEGA